MYIYIYTSIYVYTNVNMHIYIYIYLCMDINIHVYISIEYIYMCVICCRQHDVEMRRDFYIQRKCRKLCRYALVELYVHLCISVCMYVSTQDCMLVFTHINRTWHDAGIEQIE